MSVLTGQDSVGAGGMQNGKDVYAGYGGFSHFSNMGSIKARFPGRKYLVFDTHVSQVDAYDVEPGGGSASQAPAFFRQWKKVNLNKPGFYASRSQIGSVQSALSGAGISRDKYYLIVAQWDGSSFIGAGFDGKQYASTSGYDSDSFQSYMWDGTVTPPVPAFPLQQGSTDTADVTTLQVNLNKWAVVLGIKPPLAVDGQFGPATAAAVTKAQQHFGQRGIPAGECTLSIFDALKAAPGTVPPVLVGPVCAPVSNLKLVGEGPHSFRIDFKYVPGVTPADKFEVAVCQGSHLGPVISKYPRYVDFIASGDYNEAYGGVDTHASSYIIAVRAIATDGHHTSPWETVQLPKV